MVYLFLITYSVGFTETLVIEAARKAWSFSVVRRQVCTLLYQVTDRGPGLHRLARNKKLSVCVD